MINAIQVDEARTMTNAEIIDETYYEYHGKYDDGDSLVDTIDQALSKGVRLA